jgi:hypothetical protein
LELSLLLLRFCSLQLNETYGSDRIVKLLDYFEYMNHLCIVLELLSISVLDILQQNQVRDVEEWSRGLYNVDPFRVMAVAMARRSSEDSRLQWFEILPSSCCRPWSLLKTQE